MQFLARNGNQYASFDKLYGKHPALATLNKYHIDLKEKSPHEILGYLRLHKKWLMHVMICILSNYAVVVNSEGSSCHSLVRFQLASHSNDDIPEWKKSLRHIIENDDFFKSSGKAAIRLSNALCAKVKKFRETYSRLPHMQGMAYVIAISNFSNTDFFLSGDVPMQWL